MKTIKQFLIALVALFCLLPSLVFGQPNNPNDPNTDPNWDWRRGDDTSLTYPAAVYRMYVKNANQQIVPTMIPGPWGQTDVWQGLFDNKREHGWVLVCRDFGAPNRAIYGDLQTNRCPYFVLYNKYRGILRVIFIIRGASQNFTRGALIAQWIGDYNKRSATLAHLKPRSYATDKVDSSRNNSASALIANVNNDTWAWADYPMAYDPTIVPSTSELLPRIVCQLIGTTESQVVLKGAGTGIDGAPEEVRQFMTASGNGSVALTGALPSEQNQVGTSKNLGDFFTKVVGTSEKWDKFVEVAEKLGKKIKYSSNNPLRNTIFPTASFLASGALSATGLFGIAGGIAGIFDYFVGGGQPDPSPTYFGFNLEVSGTIKTEYIVNLPVSIVVPASKSNALTQPNAGSFVPLVYDKPFGLFNLTTTPVVKFKSYSQAYYGTSLSRQYNDFQIQNFQYALNPESGLELDSIRVWIVADVTANVFADMPEQDRDLALLAQWVQGQNLNVSGARRPIQLESMIDGKYVFSTIPAAENAIVGQTIQAPAGNQTADITIKVKAVFHRKDNPSEEPVVFIATYEPVLVADGTGRYPLPPPPPPAPAFRTVNVTKQYDGGTFANQTISQYTPSTTVAVNATETIGAHTYHFVAWSGDGNTDLSRTITAPGVTSLTALYKGRLLSAVSEASSQSGSQRRFARDVTSTQVFYLVYESAGKIWLTYTTNGGTTWSNEQYLGDGKNPTVAVLGYTKRIRLS